MWVYTMALYCTYSVSMLKVIILLDYMLVYTMVLYCTYSVSMLKDLEPSHHLYLL